MTDEIYEVDSKDKLVLYFEELSNGIIDTFCYVLYDFTEKEYFICGARHDGCGFQYGKFHFYCRSTETVLDYLAFILNAEESEITYGLYNFRNLFEQSDIIDLERLEIKKRDTNEIAIFLNQNFKKKRVRKILRMLREIRY